MIFLNSQVPRNLWASLPDSSIQDPSVGVSFHDDAVIWHSSTNLSSGCRLPERNPQTRAVWSRGTRTLPWEIQRGTAQLLDHQCEFLVPQFGQGQIDMATSCWQLPSFCFFVIDFLAILGHFEMTGLYGWQDVLNNCRNCFIHRRFVGPRVREFWLVKCSDLVDKKKKKRKRKIWNKNDC